MVLPGPVHAAFLDLIDFGSGPEDCWLWTGPTQGGESAGYGLFSIPGGGRFYVHRLAFATFAGPLLPGMHVLHSCDTPLCCNWTRCLRQGTHAENMADVAERGRWGVPVGSQPGTSTGAIAGPTWSYRATGTVWPAWPLTTWPSCVAAGRPGKC